MRVELDIDEETGIVTLSIEDVPEGWTYIHEYGRLSLNIPPKQEEA